MSIRAVMQIAGSVSGLLLLYACQSLSQSTALPVADLMITGGTVYDGTLADGRELDVVVDAGRIVYVGEAGAEHFRAGRQIDASGLIVAPGFIDPHTHAEDDLASHEVLERANLAFAYQGVTTVVVGNDGYGTPNIAEMADKARAQGIGTNVAYLAGFGPIREAVLGKANRAPNVGERKAMSATIHSAMCEGAWGLSAGLYYVPQNYAATEEVVELARVAGTMGGYYDTHMRDESTYNITVKGAVAETLDIGRRANLPVHISHIKALGPEVWGHSGEIIAMIVAAQAKGQRVTADQYPWSASGTRLSNALVPRPALEGGLEGLRVRLADPGERSSIRRGMAEGLERRGGANKLLVTEALGEASIQAGSTLAQIAEMMQVDPVDAAIAILMDGDARVASFNMNEADISAFAKQDWVVTGSDGSTGHPRKYASFPKAWRDLVVNGNMPIARFIERSSSQTARIIGLRGRGLLKPSFAADIVIFDPGEFAPLATYQEPSQLSDGVRHLIVNGAMLISDGAYTGGLPGVPLLKETSC